jgi:hypothetical protein
MRKVKLEGERRAADSEEGIVAIFEAMMNGRKMCPKTKCAERGVGEWNASP